jgi:putative endonuclease
MFLKSTYCYVYMVHCSDGSLYTGMTWNLHRRLRQHNGFAWGGAKYTRSHRPVTLVHVERYNSREEAHKRELEIKEMTHDQKQELVSRTTKEQILSAI